MDKLIGIGFLAAQSVIQGNQLLIVIIKKMSFMTSITVIAQLFDSNCVIN